MRLKNIVETKDFFTYQQLSDDMWRKKISEAQKQFDITFDTENNEGIEKKSITIKINELDCVFNCELCAAGGDWQDSVYYFKCQLIKGSIDEYSQYYNPYFCFIPNDSEGNQHLIKIKAKLSAPDADKSNKKPDKEKCWKSLKSYLDKLVKKNLN